MVLSFPLVGDNSSFFVTVLFSQTVFNKVGGSLAFFFATAVCVFFACFNKVGSRFLRLLFLSSGLCLLSYLLL